MLLVEDNDQVREFAESLLADLDYRVVSARLGRRGPGGARGDAVDLLFTDVMMPGMSGVELAERARASTARTCRWCSPAAIARRWRGAAPRAFETLAKPYGAATLGAALAAAQSKA